MSPVIGSSAPPGATRARSPFLSASGNPIEIIVGPATATFTKTADGGLALDPLHADYLRFASPAGLRDWMEVASRSNTLQIGAAYLGILYELHNLGDPRGDQLMRNLADMTRSLKATHQDYKVSIGQQGIYYREGHTAPGCDPVQQGKNFYSDPSTGRLTPYGGPLKYFRDMGGEMDYLFVDNGIQGADPSGQCPNLSVGDRVRGLKSYLEELRTHLFPSAKLRLTESIIFYDVVAPNGVVYPGIPNSALPYSRWNYHTGIEELANAIATVGRGQIDALSMDHDGLRHDASQYPGSAYRFADASGNAIWDRDYGRVLGVERALRAYGLKSGLYFTSAARTAELKDVPGDLALTRDYVRRVTQMVHEYLAAGGRGDLYHFESWHPVPADILPEDCPGTQLHLFREQIRELLSGSTERILA